MQQSSQVVVKPLVNTLLELFVYEIISSRYLTLWAKWKWKRILWGCRCSQWCQPSVWWLLQKSYSPKANIYRTTPQTHHPSFSIVCETIPFHPVLHPYLMGSGSHSAPALTRDTHNASRALHVAHLRHRKIRYDESPFTKACFVHISFVILDLIPWASRLNRQIWFAKFIQPLSLSLSLISHIYLCNSDHLYMGYPNGSIYSTHHQMTTDQGY